MADEPVGNLSFVSLVRRGLAAGLQTLDGTQPGPQTVLSIGLNFGGILDAAADLALVSPGDIVGLDSRVIVRTFPRPDEGDAEVLHFALIEFDQADLPWRYTPAKENAQSQLRPWINLVVLKESEAGIQPPSGSQQLPIVTTARQNLPDLAQSWAWAHTQIEGAGFSNDNPGPILDRLEGAPGMFVARLISPRVLEPSTSYVACLVPTFERGRLIGIAEDPGNTDALMPAWSASGPASVRLPVYYFWRFRTGTVGSFKELVRLIRPQAIPKEVGRRPMDVQNPGLALPAAASTPLAVEGALQSVQAAVEGPTPWPAAEKTNWINRLKQFLADPKQLVQGTDVVRVVGPPLYGQWYAAQSSVNDPLPLPGGTNPPWFYQLTTDPRTRVGAALGTTVIQNEQEALLASGWKQVGELLNINYERKVLQLGREAWLRLYTRQLLTGSRYNFFLRTGPLHGRVICRTETVCKEFDDSRIGGDLFDPSWRRWTRTWGWLGRRQGRPQQPPSTGPSLIDRLNDGQRPAPEPGPPNGLITSKDAFRGVVPGDVSITVIITLISLGKQTLLYWGLLLLWVVRELLVSQNGDCYWIAIKTLRFAIGLIRIAVSIQDVELRIKVVTGRVTPGDIQTAPPNSGFTVVTSIPPFPQPVPPRPGGPDSPDAAAFRLALIALFNRLAPPPTIATPPAMDLETCRLALVNALNPNVTVVESMEQRLVKHPSLEWQAADPLEPIFAPPEYEQPMYLPLSEVSKDWILPGLNRIKRDSAGLAVTNQGFIEAYMVGLNHEMTRELLWNEFPTDQRGTYFRQFWDTSGFVQEQGSTIPPEQFRDIRPIRQWIKTNQLGGNTARRSPQHLVLVVRAQLIQRYPNVIVYAVRAAATPAPGLTDQEKHPVFYALLKPDVACYGFELTAEQARGNPATGDPGWFFVLQEQPGEPKFFTSTPAPPPRSTAGAVADATYEQPFRVGIHGSTMLPST